MAGSETPKSGNWISTIVEGGLPQILAGPAGNAISRLLGAFVEIPAAYLDGFAQQIRDKAEARSDISQAIARQAADVASNNPEIVDRALGSMLARSYRVQRNKDAVATIAVEDLCDDPPPLESQGPSDDWMNKFERYAEDASSEDLRELFGKLLAGEIRKPGAISPATLHFVAMLDSDTARLIERALSVYVGESASVLGFLDPPMTISEIAQLDQSGFWSPDVTFTIRLDGNGLFIAQVGVANVGIAFKGVPGSEFAFDAAIVSKAGKDLAKVVKKEPDLNAIYSKCKDLDRLESVLYGTFSHHENRGKIANPIALGSN